MLARSRREPSDDWPTLFSGRQKMTGKLEVVSLGNAIEKSLLEGTLSVNARKNIEARSAAVLKKVESNDSESLVTQTPKCTLKRDKQDRFHS